MYQMWMVLHHQFRVVRRKHKHWGCSISEQSDLPETMDWAPMWTNFHWCDIYNPPASRQPFLFFHLDKNAIKIPKKYYLHEDVKWLTPPHWEDYNYMLYFNDHHMIYPPARKGYPYTATETTPCFHGRK